MHHHSNSNSGKWKRVSRQHSCPICGKGDWCLYAGPDGNPDAVICARVESDYCVGSEGAGWLHRLRDRDDWRRAPRARRVRIDEPVNSPIDFNAMAVECQTALKDHYRQRHSQELGLSADSLTVLSVGWSERHKAYTFPMRNAIGDVVGIRLRGLDGHKWSVRGGREGLFIPRGVPVESDPLVVTEGPTDCAAMFDLDFDAVGRPSCSGGVKTLVELVPHIRPKSVVIVADSDSPGQRGAQYLAARLAGYVPAGVRIVTPPNGIKDARQWKKWIDSSGISFEKARFEVQSYFEAAPILKLTYARQDSTLAQAVADAISNGVKGGAR